MDNLNDAVGPKRLHEANRLYRSGLNLREAGNALNPPVTPQRVAQLLRRGAELGLFADPRDERRAGRLCTAGEVYKVALTMTVRAEIAARLGIRLRDLESRFGRVIDEAHRQRRRERKHKRAAAVQRLTIEEYREVAARIGRNPTSSDLGHALCRRIFRHFGTFGGFMTVVGVRPDYVKGTWRERRSDGPAANDRGGVPGYGSPTLK